MENVLRVLNDLEKEGIIEKYALGGATALLFYAEPAVTEDVDVFIFLRDTPKQKNQLIDPRPYYEALQKKGYRAEKEHIIIDGIPVQLIPAYNKLVEEAVQQAATKEYNGVSARVVRIEYLLAIMLDTNRMKDKARIGQLLEEEVPFDRDKFFYILSRYKLTDKWEKVVGKDQ